jgi:hypothetical protein
MGIMTYFGTLLCHNGTTKSSQQSDSKRFSFSTLNKKGSSTVPIEEPFLVPGKTPFWFQVEFFLLNYMNSPLWKGFCMEPKMVLLGTRKITSKGSPMGTAKGLF